MKKILMLSTLLMMATATLFAQGKATEGTLYGAKFKTKKITPVTALPAKMKEATTLKNVVVSGELAQVCQAEGCWIKLKNPNGEDVLVKFRDHSFLVPKDMKASKILASGDVVKKVISVAEQRHMLEDAGATEAEQMKITAPKMEMRVDATGIIVYN